MDRRNNGSKLVKGNKRSGHESQITVKEKENIKCKNQTSDKEY